MEQIGTIIGVFITFLGLLFGVFKWLHSILMARISSMEDRSNKRYKRLDTKISNLVENHNKLQDDVVKLTNDLKHYTKDLDIYRNAIQ